jgi:hypothetical protein
MVGVVTADDLQRCVSGGSFIEHLDRTFDCIRFNLGIGITTVRKMKMEKENRVRSYS